MTDKLTYFDGRGRAEVTRMLYKLAKKDFVDCRVKMEDWPALQKTLPLGQMPFLETKEATIVQSMSIARYVARELKLSGSTSLEQAVCDMICDTSSDIMNAGTPIMFGPPEGKEAAITKVKGLIEGMNKLIKLNKKGKFILGDKPSLADAAILATCDFLNVTKCAPSSGEMADAGKAFSKVPEIAAWIKARPDTSF